MSFFPPLITGRIVRHNVFIPQLEAAANRDRLSDRLSRGSPMLIVGLIKKIMFAHGTARITDLLFEAVSKGALSFVDDGMAATAFSLRNYLGFSDCSDMEI